MPTHREQFLKRHKLPLNESLSLQEVARVAKVPIAALREVYDRGEGAYSSNPTSVRSKGSFAKNPSLKAVPVSGRLSMAQWAMARVYSFVNKGAGTYGKADADIVRKYGINL
jgi:hypothetical protein